MSKNHRSQKQETFVFKSTCGFRLENERDALLRFQTRSPFIRPLIDEVEEPSGFILKHLDDDLLHASNTKTLTRAELNFVTRGVLEALDTLHSQGFVHTGASHYSD